jgi:hypothetical protein
MNQDDIMVARDARRYLERRAIDATLAVVSCHKGFITISGTIRRMRSQPYTDLNEELEMFRKLAMRNLRDIKGITIDARIQRLEKIEKKEHHETQVGAHIPGHSAAPAPGAKPNLPGRH